MAVFSSREGWGGGNGQYPQWCHNWKKWLC